MTIARVKAPVCPLIEDTGQPGVIGPKSSQLLFGESFEIEIEDGEWFYGRSIADGYKGYIHVQNLSFDAPPPTHFVNALSTHIYPAPDFKTQPLMKLSMMAQVTSNAKTQNGFMAITDLGWVFSRHLAALGEKTSKTDFVETAMKFISTPYLYGGRSSDGIDCSGLVQIAMQRSGYACPRDSSEQKILGTSIEEGNENFRHGDLVFFKGHVGIMVDEKNILNATARSMDTRIEPLENLIKAYNGIAAIRRL